MKWALEADDFGNIFHTTIDANGELHRRPINVEDDVSAEPALVQLAAKETWTKEVVSAARDLRAKREQEATERLRDQKAAQEVQQAADDAALTARAVAVLKAAGIDLDAIAAHSKM